MRLLSDALLMGKRAHDYFIQVQHAHKFDPERICPTYHIFDCLQDSTYQFEFFDNPMVRPFWQYTNQLLQHMQLPYQVSTIDQALLAIYDLGGNSDINKIVNLNLITLTLKAIWNTYVGQMAKWRTHIIPKVKQYAKRKLMSSYKTQLQSEIYQLPHHLHSIKL